MTAMRGGGRSDQSKICCFSVRVKQRLARHSEDREFFLASWLTADFWLRRIHIYLFTTNKLCNYKNDLLFHIYTEKSVIYYCALATADTKIGTD